VTLWLSLLVAAAHAKKIEVDIDIGLGPTFDQFSGPVRRDQTLHYGARLNLEVIIDKGDIRKLKSRIPPQYRKMAMKLEEVRIRPAWFLLPQTVHLSPKSENTGVYGATWELLGMDVPFVREPFRLAATAGLPLSVIHVSSDTLPSPTNVVRLGLSGGGDLEVPITPGFLLGGGWTSLLHIPQPLGSGVFTSGPGRESVWHVGQAYGQVHVRFPMTIDI